VQRCSCSRQSCPISFEADRNGRRNLHGRGRHANPMNARNRLPHHEIGSRLST
jgi:hypothetical protein